MGNKCGKCSDNDCDLCELIKCYYKQLEAVGYVTENESAKLLMAMMLDCIRKEQPELFDLGCKPSYINAN